MKNISFFINIYFYITTVICSCCLTYVGYPLKSTSPLFGNTSELEAYN